MPASRVPVVLTLLIVLSTAAFASPDHRTQIIGQPVVRLAPSNLSSAIDSALLWLAHNQSADGSYGAYQEHLAAALLLVGSPTEQLLDLVLGTVWRSRCSGGSTVQSGSKFEPESRQHHDRG